MVKSKQEIAALLLSRRDEIKGLGVKTVSLFGSFVKGQQTEESDVDLLVEFAHGEKNFRNFMHLAFLLEDLFRRKVELVTPESLSPYLKPRILQEMEDVIH